MKLKEAVILAGGMGTRLKSVVNEVPKPMAPINGKPFLEYLMEHLIRNGIERILFSVGFKSNIISDHFGSNFQGCSLEYIYEEEPLGTGGAIKEALKSVHNEHVLVTNGDSIFVTDIQGQFVFHQNSNSDVTLGLKHMTNFDRYGTVLYDENSRITEFKEKEAVEEGLINGGVYIFKVKSFLSLNFPEKFSIENEYFQKFTPVHNLFGYRSDGYFLDIGIPEDFKRAQEEFKRFER